MRSEANWKKQLDFAYAQIDYWKQMAFANKEELEYYRGIVEEAVAKGAILVVDEDGNDLMLFDDDDDEGQLNVKGWNFPFNKKDDDDFDDEEMI